ncbi:MAG: cbb3-type cytochrome oxidase assembly protein CcoS [Methylophaga sp.]|nr:cbb3-type cytochrome oxidase assembly protein CcoS [Methylophaga sp.]
MEVIYGLLPGMLLLGIIGVAVFFWAVRSGQYDDMEGAAHRVLMDDDEPESDDKTVETDDSEDDNTSEPPRS